MPDTNDLTRQENKEITENKLEEIWIIFQESLIKAAKATLPIKKIKKDNNQNKKNIIEITPEHKRYRQAFKLLEALNKAEISRKQEDF